MDSKEINKLMRMGRPVLVELATKLGIAVKDEDKAKDLAFWIVESVEDLNTWLEAKEGTVNNKKVEKSDKPKLYKGKCVKTGEKLYTNGK